MKTFLKIIVLSLFTSFSANCQIHDIIVDFESRTQPMLPEDLEPGDAYRIIVQNINPNLYTIVINSKDTLTSAPLKIPSLADVGMGSSVAAATQKTADKKKMLPADKAVLDELNTFPIVLKTHEAALTADTNKYQGLIFEIYRQRIDQLSFSPTTTLYDGTSKMDDFIKLRAEVLTLSGKLDIAKSKFDNFSKDPGTESFLKRNPSYKTTVETIAKTFALYISKAKEVTDAVTAENVEKLIKSVIYLDGKNRSFTSLPLQFTKEQSTVDIKFQPRDASINVPVEHMSFVFPIASQEYWAIGSSFYYANLFNSRYSIKQTVAGDAPQYEVVHQERLKGEAGVALFLRGGKKLKWIDKNVGVHFNIGPGLSIVDNAKPRLLVGCGISYGKKHCVTLDYGAIGGYVDRKSNGFETGAAYLAKPENLTDSKLQVANFFAIGYTFKL